MRGCSKATGGSLQYLGNWDPGPIVDEGLVEACQVSDGLGFVKRSRQILGSLGAIKMRLPQARSSCTPRLSSLLRTQGSIDNSNRLGFAILVAPHYPGRSTK